MAARRRVPAAAFVLAVAGLLAQEPAARVAALAVATSTSIFVPTQSDNPQNPYITVLATPAGMVGPREEGASRKYLIASFPDMKQVAYCQLPDNVWRPLVLGEVTTPTGVAVDIANARLYVADAPEGKIYKYNLKIRPDGKLMTDGYQGVAVVGYSAKWLTVNSIGDLYFTGKATVEPPQSAYEAVMRQDGAKINFDNAFGSTEIYSRTNTGNPNPKVWMPSGLAVDSFNIYWGNQEMGTAHGTIVKGSRQNIGGLANGNQIGLLSTAMDEVRGMCSTGTSLLYLTPQGVYGVPKDQATVITDGSAGLIAAPPAGDTNAPAFDPVSIAWDGDGTAYFTDATAGVVYSIPSDGLKQQNLTKFVDAPGVYGMALYAQSGAHRGTRGLVGIVFLSALFTYVNWA